MEVQDEEETEKIIDKWTSTKEAHKVTGLEENRTYILREKTAPYGYETTEEIEFVVSENEENSKNRNERYANFTKYKISKN